MVWDIWQSLPGAAGLVALLPILLHGIERIFERVELLGVDTLFSAVREDERVEVKRVANNAIVFRAVGSYFQFEKSVHFIISLVVFCGASLVGSATEHNTGRNLWWAAGGIAVLLAFALIFVMFLARNRYAMSEVDPLVLWRRAAYLLLCATLAVEIGMRV